MASTSASPTSTNGSSSATLSVTDPMERWAFAAAASCVAEATTYPLDMVKTRLQLQNELGKTLVGASATAQRSYTQVFKDVLAQEGFAALYAGAGVAIVRQIFNAGVSIGLYPSVRSLLLGQGQDAADAPLWKRAAAGCVTGGIGQSIANPFDVVKVRVQADGRLRLIGKQPRYNGAGDAARKILSQEGVAGLYTALGSSVWRAAIINAAGISSYDHTKQFVKRTLGSDQGWAPQMVGSLVAGVSTTIVSTPLDVVKTRLMNNPTAYRGPNDCLMQLIRSEGVWSLYKGTIPTYKRQAVFNFVFWQVLEEMQKVTGRQRL